MLKRELDRGALLAAGRFFTINDAGMPRRGRKNPIPAPRYAGSKESIEGTAARGGRCQFGAARKRRAELATNRDLYVAALRS